MASATDTRTDTKLGAPYEFGITGGNSPTARSRGRVSFIYLRGCVKDRMRTRYRLIRRGVRNGAFYCVDTKTGKRTSLQTCNEDEARQIINAKNQALRQPVLNMQIAKAYLYGTDNGIATRTWQQALDALIACKKGENQNRWKRGGKEKPFDLTAIKSSSLPVAKPHGAVADIAGAFRFSICPWRFYVSKTGIGIPAQYL